MKNITTTTILIFLLLATTNITNAQWSLIGNDIDGETTGDNSGVSVCLSSDGNTVAIGAFYNDGNGTNSGHVRIHNYSGGIWTQKGGDIDGEDSFDRSGISVSLSSDGNTVAIGAGDNDGNGTSAGHVRIYRYSSGIWTQMGSDIDGEAADDYSGVPVCLSSDGNIVAIGASTNYGSGLHSGHARIYYYSGGIWTQMGNDIDGEGASDQSGWSLSLSDDGSIVAIGAIMNNGNGLASGHVRIYNYSGGAWSQIGDDINGEASNDQSGYSVSLSSDGNTVAIGAIGNDGNGNYAGHVRIYNYSGGVWSQLGADIDGESADNYFGNSVSLSSDGNIVAIGAPGNDSNGSMSGHVRIYNYSVGAWLQQGNDIEGENPNDYSGFVVDLNSDGSMVAIGAYYNDGNGIDAGHVRVYNYASGIKENTANTKITIYPNPTTGKIRIEAEGIEKIEAINLIGKTIYTGNEKEIDLRKEPKGIYFIKVITNKQTISKKIIKE